MRRPAAITTDWRPRRRPWRWPSIARPKLYRLAVEFQPAEGAQERDLRVKLADALANAGRGAEAAHAYQAAARGASASQVLELQRRAAYHYCISGRLEEGKAAFGAVLRQRRHAPAANARPRALLLLVRPGSICGCAALASASATRPPFPSRTSIASTWPGRHPLA